MAHTIQLPEDAQPENAPAKSKGKAANPAAPADFGQFVGLFLGAAAQNTELSGKKVSAKTCPPDVAVQPALQPAAEPMPQTATDASAALPEKAGQFLGAAAQNTELSDKKIGAKTGPPDVAVQPAFQPAAEPILQTATDASAALPEKAGPFLGVEATDALTGEEAKGELPVTAADSEDEAVPAAESGNEDAVTGTAHDRATTADGNAADRTKAEKTAEGAQQEKPNLHEFLAKQDPSKSVGDEKKADEPVGTDGTGALRTNGDFSTVMHQESSVARNVTAQINGATITRRPHEGSETAPLRPLGTADILDPAPAITKDGNRLAVKFEQDGLGRLDIDLRLHKGVINAQIMVVDDSTKTLIENNVQQILDSLLKAGLSVGGFSVSLKGGGRQNGAPAEQYGYGTERAGSAAGEAAGSAQRVAPNGLVSIFI